jgi:hypothetical protein
MGLGAVIYIPSFIKTDSGIQKLIGEDTQTHKHTQTTMWSHKPTLFFKVRKVGQKNYNLDIIIV